MEYLCKLAFDPRGLNIDKNCSVTCGVYGTQRILDDNAIANDLDQEVFLELIEPLVNFCSYIWWQHLLRATTRTSIRAIFL